MGSIPNISLLNSVAMGDKSADLILSNCSLVNVYTNEIQEKIEIAIKNDRIAYVGPDASHAKGSSTKIIDVQNKFVSPSFADPHIHIDHFLSPSEFIKQSLLHGVTSLFPDSIDIVSTTGSRGFREFVKLTTKLPMRFFHVIPGGLPVDPKFSFSKKMSLSEIKSAIKLDDVIGLGEVFSWTKVTKRDSATMKCLSFMLDNGCVINGHTAGIGEKKLNAYISSGILSCHEPINFQEVLDRLRLGMWVMIREGSIRRDLKEILPLVLSNGIFTNRLMFCSDGLDPIDITKYGHIDYCVNEAIKLGLEPIEAICIASRNCFDYYNMGKDLGGIAPGRLADILIFNKLEKIKPSKVFVGGKLVVSDSKLVFNVRKDTLPKPLARTVRTRRLSEKDFLVPYKKKTANVNLITLKTEIITEKSNHDLNVIRGNVAPSRDNDIWKVAAFDRIFGTKKHSIAFLKNFNANVGAFASTWNFHENNLLVIGMNEKDMSVASNHLIKSNGGMTVVKNGKVLASMPLQMAGIISTDSFEQVRKNYSKINSTLYDRGCKFKRPHLVPIFLPFLALPEIRILNTGLVDVKKRQYIPSINS